MKFIKSILLIFLILVIIVESIQAFQTNYDKKSVAKKKIEILANKCWNNRSNNPKAALDFGYEALRSIQESGIDDFESTVLNYIGVVYRNLGKLDSAYFYYKSAYALAKSKKDKPQMAYSLTNLGDYYSKNALYSTALEKLLQAYDIFESLQDKRGMAYTTNYIGEIYLITKDYSKAKIFLLNAANLRLSNKDDRGYAKSLLNIAALEEEQNLFQDALSNLQQALKISNKIGYKNGISRTYSKLSDIYFKKGRIDSSLYYRQMALKIALSIENKYSEIQNYNRLGKIYLQINNLSKAKYYLSLSENEAKKTGHFAELLEAYSLLTNLSTAENNFRNAYLYQKKYQELNEKLFGQETKNKIADLQTAFAIEKKEKENALLKKDVEFEKKTRNYLILISLLVLIGIILVLSQNRLQKRTNNLLKELNDSKDKFFSIIAHDLKNPFGAILSYSELLHSEYSEMNDDERMEIITGIQSASIQVQNLLNDLLTWAQAQKGEIGMNRIKLNLYEVIYETVDSYKHVAEQKKIKLIIDADKEIDVLADKLIIKTIVGNLLNNAIKFSFPESEVIISAKPRKNKIEISVTDFGVGIDEETAKKLFNLSSKFTTKGTANEIGTGLGLKICNEFANIHKGKIQVESKPNAGSKFTFTFDLD